jgi:membrane protease YdiL (CAAX protease family)
MLFLLKRRWPTAVLGLLILCSLGLLFRWLLRSGPDFSFSLPNVALGAAVFTAVVCSDLILHGLFSLLFGELYRNRYRELAAVFQGQSARAVLAGAAMAGLGEEVLFRGLSTELIFLLPAAVVFGALHHIRRPLWPFTFWAMYQGVLFALALAWSGALCVTMTAHFLHDFCGFLVFRHINRESQ